MRGLLGVSIGNVTGWEIWMPVGLVPEGETVVSLSDSNDGRGRVEPEIMLNNIWGSRVK